MSGSGGKHLALFDFDGTLTYKDSFMQFIRYSKGSFKYFLGLFILSPILILYKAKLLANDKAKILVLRYYFSGIALEEFKSKADGFAMEKIPRMLRKSAMDRLRWHINQQHKVVVVSASINLWLKKWCDLLNIQLIATELDIKQGKITGRLSTPNCYGEEKVKRIKLELQLDQYERIYAYGDTQGDKPMLALAHEKFYRSF